ncbi:ABC transporter permease, partial [Staphylococcus felis]
MSNLGNIISVSLRSILKNKRRNIFTMIGIIIGIAAVITIMSLGNGFKQTANKQFSDAGASKDAALISFAANNFDNPNPEPFTDADIDLAKQVDGVTDARIKADDTFGLSSEAEIPKKKTDISIVKQKEVTNASEGKGFTTDDNDMKNRVVTISSQVADDLFKGDAVG